MPSILIVDDSRPVRTVLRHILQDAGFTIYEAPDGRTALEVYGRTAIDVLMVDAQMPEWDGLTTIRTFHDTFPNSPARIILMTGDPTVWPLPDDRSEAGERVHRIIAKPFHSSALLDEIRQELRAQAASVNVS